MMKYLVFLFLVSSCSSIKPKYQAHWWNKVSKKDLAWWEISPSSVDPANNEVILSKRNELGILSNFANTPFRFRGDSYQSIEGLWQSMKFPESTNDPRNRYGIWIYKRSDVAQMIGPKAKKAGDFASKLMKKNNINWVSFQNNKMSYRTSARGSHYKIIKEAMGCKLLQNKKVEKILLSTGNLNLRPDHLTKKTDPPAWKYYQIWMELRDEIKLKKEIACKR